MSPGEREEGAKKLLTALGRLGTRKDRKPMPMEPIAEEVLHEVLQNSHHPPCHALWGVMVANTVVCACLAVAVPAVGWWVARTVGMLEQHDVELAKAASTRDNVIAEVRVEMRYMNEKLDNSQHMLSALARAEGIKVVVPAAPASLP